MRFKPVTVNGVTFDHGEDADIRFLADHYGDFPAELLAADAVELDLGCGSGVLACALAGRYPGRSVLAADVMLGRLRKIVRRAKREKLGRLAVLRSEARYLVSRLLPDHSVDRIHLLCPDPWPKEKHSGHRLLTSDFASSLHRVLKDGGVFHFASDDEVYFAAGCRAIDDSGLFRRDDAAVDDVRDVHTDFEARWLAGGKRVPHAAWRTVPGVWCGFGH